MTSIPTTLSDLDPEWLTEALGPDVLGGGAVASCETQVLTAGVGFIGQLARLRPTYEGAPDDAPASLIAKVPIDDPGGRAVGAMLRLYERESEFYRSMSSAVSVRVPRCYANLADPESQAYCLLLEDLGHMETIDQRDGASLDQAIDVLEAIASFHAHWLGARGERYDWLPRVTDPMIQGFIGGYEAAREHLHATMSERIDPRADETAQRLAPSRVRLLERVDELIPTVVHGDFRLDNMFFDTDRVALFDWQAMMRTTPMWDVVYFLGTNVEPGVLREHHEQLLASYGAAYAAAGGPELSVDEMMAMAQTIWAPFTLMGTVLLSQLDFTSESGQALIDVLYPRAVNAGDVFDVHSYQP